MTTAEIWNVVILLVQSAILIGQLRLSKQINKQTLSKEKGYFIIDKTNFVVAEEYEDGPAGFFDLKSNYGIRFYVAGNADVIVCGERCSINGIIRENFTTPSNAYFTLDKRFNKHAVEIKISDNEEKQEQLDFEFVFKLKNAVGYKYAEKVDVTFVKKNVAPEKNKITQEDAELEKKDVPHSIWEIEKYNTMFLKWNQVK